MAWVGNIRQKFETICNEVDNIVGQNAAQYVGNRVNNVGLNMKRFYSGVVQDLVIPSGVSLNCEAQAVSLKTNDATRNDFQSIIHSDEDLETEQSPLQPSDLDLLVEHSNFSLSRQQPVNESTTNGQFELGTLLENVDKGLETECVDASPEDTSLKKLIPPHDKYFSEANGESTGIDCENEVESQVVAPVFDDSYFVHDAPSTVTLPELHFSVSFSGKGLALEQLNNFSRNEGSFMSAEDSVVTEKYFPLIPSAEKQCSEATNGFTESDRENECEFMAEAKFSNSVYEEESQSAQIAGTNSSADGSNFVSNASAAVIFPAKDFWIAPSGKGVGEMKLACSISSMGSHDLSDNPLGNIPPNILSCCNPVNSAGYDFDGSGVVQDLSPPSVDSNHFQSIINIDKDHGCSSPTKQLTLQPSSLDFVVEESGDSFSRGHPVNESTACIHGFSLEVGTSPENGEESLKTEYVGATQIAGTEHSATNSYCVTDAPGVMELVCSTSSMGHDLYDNPLENIPGNNLSCSNCVNSAGPDFDGSVSPKSCTFSPTVSCKIKEMGLTSSNCVLPTKSIGCYGDSTCVGRDLTDSKMENIDLSDDVSDKARLAKSCEIADDRSLYEASHRIPKFRSFKKRIQDAFSSKKRIIKEYERLRTLYCDLEDIDIEPTRAKDLLSSTATVEDSCSGISSKIPQDSEWELL